MGYLCCIGGLQGIPVVCSSDFSSSAADVGDLKSRLMMLCLLYVSKTPVFQSFSFQSFVEHFLHVNVIFDMH